jgi:hypothetical protein
MKKFDLLSIIGFAFLFFTIIFAGNIKVSHSSLIATNSTISIEIGTTLNFLPTLINAIASALGAGLVAFSLTIFAIVTGEANTEKITRQLSFDNPNSNCPNF